MTFELKLAGKRLAAAILILLAGCSRWPPPLPKAAAPGP